MQIAAKELAVFLSGEIIGDANVTVTQAGKIEFGKKGDICFLGNSKYEPFAYTTEASVLLVDKNFVPKQTIQPTLIRVADVYASVALLLEKFGEKKETLISDISSRSSIHPSAKIGERAIIGDFTVVEDNVFIGNDCTLHPQVYIGKNCSIGNHVTLHAGVKIYAGSILGNNIEIHANAVIGSDGFGFAPQPDGSYKKINHIGNVVIEDNVEIGANTTIDRGSIGATLIRKGVKLDNLIQIAHNVDIGEHTVIAAQTGVAGSTKIGKFNRIGGQVGIVGHIIIGDHVQIQAQSGVASNVPDNSKLYGSPAIEYRNYLKSYAIFKKAGK
jgi:UDP-3-O-[3-hydroxymyristoyl] glucosamine N-acyltransferase